MSKKRDITNKVQSQRGASLPLALLLFLICAMTASIVLAAGTAAAGRASNLAESDQAYYSVTSAAGLFRDKLLGTDGKGHEVTVAVMATTGASPSYQIRVTTDGAAASGEYSLLERAAISLLFGGRQGSDNGSAQDAARAYFTSSPWASWPNFSDFSGADVGEFTLSHAGSLSTEQAEALSLNVKASIDAAGDLVLTFEKPGATADDQMSVLNLTCHADIESGAIDATESGSNVEIKYATITWTPDVVEKG